jgi:hypothetical protein
MQAPLIRFYRHNPRSILWWNTPATIPAWYDRVPEFKASL